MLISLLLGTFVTGSAELLTAGLLLQISSGLESRSRPPARCSARTPSDWPSAARC